jgi:FlaA1/EpsC-like NDP-sugar epimerase
LTKAIRVAVLVLLDAAVFNLSYILAFLLRFELDDANTTGFAQYFPAYSHNFIYLTIIKIIIFFVVGMYRSLWDFAGPSELLKVALASLISAAAAIVFLILIQQQPAMPRSIYVFSFIFDTIFAGAVRFMYRYARSIRQNQGFKGFISQFRSGGEAGVSGISRIMLVGAGEAGAAIIREIKANPQQYKKVVVCIDDAPAKRGQTFMGVKIGGGREDIPALALKYNIDEIIVAIPSASRSQIKGIVAAAGLTGAKVQILPSMMDLIGGAVSVSALRNVDIEDLLGRDPVRLDLKSISGYLEGRVVMVTGGGGSIGSELCRQIAKFGPGKLIALDNYENSVFELEQELRLYYPDLDFEPVIASVRDRTRLGQVFAQLRPQVIFHAAAHKHVPLMEASPAEAVVNNVLGTKNVVDFAAEYATEKFVMISTDKAVNPTNVMGATKRLAEMIVQDKSAAVNSQVGVPGGAAAPGGATAFAVVRFGNVLGSNGSVIPVFKKQIERGGPVTVTDREITRYFMTIPEAVQLVIQAGAMTNGGEIFILDMGDPVRILDLAENMIRLSGYEPYEEIDIAITELRPGEKLHEELSYESERLKKTDHEKIFLGQQADPTDPLARALRGAGTGVGVRIGTGIATGIATGGVAEAGAGTGAGVEAGAGAEAEAGAGAGVNPGMSLEDIINNEVLNMSDEEVRRWIKEYLPSYTG